MTIVVCTAWLGPADYLEPPPIQRPGVRYLCLTDRHTVTRGWERVAAHATRDSRRTARRAKTSFDWLPAHDVSVWMDASFSLLVDPRAIVEAAGDAAIAGFPHPDRSRISQEAEAIIRFGLAPADAVRQQVAVYRREGFDTDETPQPRLTTTGLLVRWSTPDVERFHAAWWHELDTHTLRDQLSVDVVAWRRHLTIGVLPGHYRDNALARYHSSAHRRGRIAS